MTKGGSVEYIGVLLGLNMADFTKRSQQMLEEVGKKGVEVMKGNMEHEDYTGDTRGSVMWRTNKKYEAPSRTSFLIEPPAGDNSVLVGSANPTATYIEYGTPMHRTSNNWEEFVKAIKKWCQDKGIPDEAVFPIIKKIHDTGTIAHPFALKTAQDMTTFFMEEGHAMLSEFLATKKYVNVGKRD
jgi:hypothetical protein